MSLGNSTSIFLIILVVGASMLGIHSVRIVYWRRPIEEDGDARKIWSDAKLIAIVTCAAIAVILLARFLYNIAGVFTR